MKKFLYLILLFFCVHTLSAEVSLTAVLIHEGEISTFTTTSAFKNAVEKAVDGDVITLSSGNFAATDINKNITVRGAGMMPGENPTIITGDFKVNANSKDGVLTFESMYLPGTITLNQGNGITFLKTYLNMINGQTSNLEMRINSLRFIHSFITDYIYLDRMNVNSAEFVNCYINSFTNGGGSASSASLSNCVISHIVGADKSSFQNCIILKASNSSSSSNTFNNCVSNTFNFVGQPITAGNKYMPEVIDFFKEDTLTYELKDEYALTLLGNDGSQAGIYGGSLPFSPQTTGLKITKFNVASKTTSDGKLPIEISVDAN